MANGQSYGGKLQWIKAYHENDEPGNTGTPDMLGNCTRCGKKLPNHIAQDAHNAKVHLQ